MIISRTCKKCGLKKEINDFPIYKKTEEKELRRYRRAKIKSTNIDNNLLLVMKEETIYCPICRVKMNDINHHPKQYNLDHIIPLNCDGTHSIDNVRYICRNCNLSRPKNGSDLGGILS
jgi:5-methylcytosine-specific restriction endonuclease McrA